jgi:phospholipase C
MLVVSPWSHGGWINSQVFDHTSVLRFLELWTGVKEPNISAWRRAICGDLTSCFDFAAPRFIVPILPDTTVLRQHADAVESKLPAPTPPPTGQQTFPIQEPGSARARAVPYQPLANLELDTGRLLASMSNSGQAALQLGFYAHHALGDSADRFDVAPGSTVTTSVTPDPLTGAYDVEVHGPNGFFRHASGTVLGPESGVDATLTLVGGDRNPRLRLSVRNRSRQFQTVNVSGLPDGPRRLDLNRGSNEAIDLDPLDDRNGWYDLVVSVQGRPSFTRRFAGHLENGEPSRTSPS